MQRALPIIPMELAHVPSLHAAMDRIARERRYFALLEAPPLDEMTKIVRDNIEQQNPQFAAIDAGAVVGWCDITRMAKRVVFAHRGTLAIGILPEYRGRGLGQALMTRALTAARQAGVLRVELQVRADNARAIALYRRLGFRREGILRDAQFVDGAFHDLWVMALSWRR